MLSLAVVLAFSIGSSSGASTHKKSDSKIEYSVAVEKAVINSEVIPLMEFSVKNSIYKYCGEGSSNEKVNSLKSDIKPDCIITACRYDLRKKFYYDNFRLRNHRNIKYSPFYRTVLT
jgi:hypothetical protein